MYRMGNHQVYLADSSISNQDQVVSFQSALEVNNL